MHLHFEVIPFKRKFHWRKRIRERFFGTFERPYFLLNLISQRERWYKMEFCDVYVVARKLLSLNFSWFLVESAQQKTRTHIITHRSKVAVIVIANVKSVKKSLKNAELNSEKDSNCRRMQRTKADVTILSKKNDCCLLLRCQDFFADWWNAASTFFSLTSFSLSLRILQ